MSASEARVASQGRQIISTEAKVLSAEGKVLATWHLDDACVRGCGVTRFVVKRVYEPADLNDGTRVLVDRLWPRGIAKERARIDLWLKDIAPSDALRKRFHGSPEAWDAFRTACTPPNWTGPRLRPRRGHYWTVCDPGR